MEVDDGICFCHSLRLYDESTLVGVLVSETARAIPFDHMGASPCSTTTIVRQRTGGFEASIHQPGMPLLELAALRTEPVMVVRWHMDVDGGIFEGTAFTIAGEILARCRYVLEPGQTVTVEDLRAICIEGAVAKGMLKSRNQYIRMFLDGVDLCELPEHGTIWSHRASFCPARVRLSQKTNLERLRWARWMMALRDGSASLGDDDPAHWA